MGVQRALVFPWRRCYNGGMPLIAQTRAEQNDATLDPWSAVHLGAGLAAGLVGMGVVPATTLAVAYEVIEHQAEQTGLGRKIFLTQGPESASNIVADIALFVGGVLLGHRWLRT